MPRWVEKGGIKMDERICPECKEELDNEDIENGICSYCGYDLTELEDYLLWKTFIMW